MQAVAHLAARSGALAAALALGGCVEDRSALGPGAACLRSSECASELACVDGRCGDGLGPLEDDGTPTVPDAGPPDGGPDGGSPVDGGPDAGGGPDGGGDDAGPPADAGGPADGGADGGGPSDGGIDGGGPSDAGVDGGGPADGGGPDGAG